MNRFLMGILIYLLSTAALLAGPVYMALDVGQSQATEGCTDTDMLGSAMNVSSCQDTDVAYRFAGGYWFNENLGVEASYADLGAVTDAEGAIFLTPFAAKWETRAWQLGALGNLPLNETFAVFAKFALVQSTMKMTVSSLGGVIVESADSTGWGFGLGAAYHFVNDTNLRLQFEHLEGVGDDDTTGTTDMRFYSLGLVFGF